MAGIYLPTIAYENGTSCWKQPLTLLFSRSHFSLLGVVSGEGPLVEGPLVPLFEGKDTPTPLPVSRNRAFWWCIGGACRIVQHVVRGPLTSAHPRTPFIYSHRSGC